MTTSHYEKLLKLAHQQAGYFTTKQALNIGYTHQTQHFHVAVGNWIRIDRGIFRLPAWPDGEYDSFVRWSLWARGRGVISHDSALLVHQIGDANPSEVHLTVPSSFRSKAAAVVLHRANLGPKEIENRLGFQVTTPTRTIFDIATSNVDLGELITVIEDALDSGLTTRGKLLQNVDEHGKHAALRLERAIISLESEK